MAVVATLLASLPWWVYVLVGVPVCAVVVVQILIRLPKKMSEFKLPNGMTVWQWNKGETEFLYDEIFVGDLYTSGTIKLEPGNTVFDVGANIGMFALHAHKQTGGNVVVHSFEPMPKIHAVCAANARRFDPKRTSLHTYQMGLSDKPASVTFEFHPHFSIWSTSDAEFDKTRESRVVRDMPAMLQNVKWLPNFIGVPLGRWFTRSVLNKVEKVQAELSTLSHMMHKLGVQRIDLLKVDVEGAELAVLQGVDDADWPKIQQVVLEAEDFAIVRQLTALLESKGFRVQSRATERERSPGSLSEVSCVMATRA